MSVNSRKKDLGTCQFCGEPIKEVRCGWGCFTPGCDALIYRDDRFFLKVLGRKVTRPEAVRLLMGDCIHMRDASVKGKPADIELSWGIKDDPRFRYGYFIKFIRGSKPNSDKDGTSAFDVLNGESS